jgi:hypothetical protein
LVLPFFPRVVDPLSPTIADSIMVEVEDLNHYGVGLFDFCVGDISFVFSRSPLRARSKEVGARAFRPLHSSFPEPNNLVYSEFIKIALGVCKDNYFLHVSHNQ